MALLAHPHAALPLEGIVPGAVAVVAGDARDLPAGFERHPGRDARRRPVRVLLVLQLEVHRVPGPGVTRAAARKPRMAGGAEGREAGGGVVERTAGAGRAGPPFFVPPLPP